MGRQTQLQYSEVADHGLSSEVELASLPPTAAGRAKQQLDDDTVTLLQAIDTAYSPVHGGNTNTSHNGVQAWFANWRLGRHAVLNSDPGDAEEIGSPFRGWRKAVITAAAVTGFVLLVNTIFAACAFVKFKVDDGVGTIYAGDCNVVERWNTALHLLINLLGTALLGASSFTMQCLSSPTRSELNDAHAKRVSLDIGIASVKNLFHMKAWKGIVWALLCFSTLPLHLLWNSTIFSTSGTNLFSYVMAEEGFLNGVSYQEPDNNYTNCHNMYQHTSQTELIKAMYHGYRSGFYTSLTIDQCLEAYVDVKFLNGRRNLIMIIEKPDTGTNMSSCGYNEERWNGSSVAALELNQYPGSYWLYPYVEYIKASSSRQSIESGGSWQVGDFTVKSCLSEVAKVSQCRLQFVSYILYVVIGCNTVKLICMCCAARYLWDLDEPILATVGDAVTSFLEHGDETTARWCLLDLQSLRAWRHPWAKHGYDSRYDRQTTRRLYSATTSTRWWSIILLCTGYATAGFVLFRLSVDLSGYNMKRAMEQKFGAVDSAMTLGLEGGAGVKLVRDIVVANSFQVVLSTTYFLYNSLYTAQCAALEWATYAHGKRKSLRVTWPRGQQRSTYYLQLPYRYSIPLTISLVLMHFLISQSIFLARLQYYNSVGRLTDYGFNDVGFSPRATATACCVGVVMILAQILHACRPLDNRIPIHGNSSAVISAMCHPDEDPADKLRRPFSDQWEEDSIATKPIMWGVTKQPAEQGSSSSKDDKAGHCGFSADTVELPKAGMHYR